MKCEKCGNIMVERDSYDRGRHTRKVFVCDRCGETKIKKAGLIQNKAGRRR